MSDPSIPSPVQEELDHLSRIRTLLIENPEDAARSEDEVVRELIRLRDEHRDAKEEDKGSLQTQLTQTMAVLDQVRKARERERVDPDAPYFAHLQLSENNTHRDIFLGRATRLSHGLRIVDWRNAPISRLFYQYEEGDEYEEEMAGRVREGHVTVRRNVHIQDGELLRVGAPDSSWIRTGNDSWRELSRESIRLAGGQGSALRAGSAERSRLGSNQRHRANKHLPDIAALIDPDQFALISAQDSGVVVLRGSAGSGKTTVALHRIAYLAYQGPHKFPTRRVLVVVWGRAMRDYVAHVLPALGVKGVHVTTWGSWARQQVIRHLPALPRNVSDDTPEPASRVKLHPGVSELLEAHIRNTPGPARPEQVIDDWAQVITNRSAIAQAMGIDITPGALDRAMAWNTQQAAEIMHWMDSPEDRQASAEEGTDPRLDPEDYALLLRAWQKRMGPLRDRKRKPLRHVHIVLDEVQDFSPVEVQVLLDTTEKNQSVTLAGDVRQHISEQAGFSTWQGFLDRIGIESTALNTLQVSYRSTHPITRFALQVLDDDNEPAPRTTRDGPPVELFRFSDHGACVAFLSEELKQLIEQEPLANVALLTPSAELSRTYASGLTRADLPDVRLVVDQQFAFAAGIDVVEASQVKGLEFDYVVIIEPNARHYPDTPHHRRLLHVAGTRAVHQLWLTCVGTPSSILPDMNADPDES